MRVTIINRTILLIQQRRMKLLNTALLLSISSSCTNAFNMNMNAGNNGAGRSKLTRQYKNIMSIHHGISGMAPPPGEPEPEVS